MITAVLPADLADGERVSIPDQGYHDNVENKYGSLVLSCWLRPTDGLVIEHGEPVAVLNASAEEGLPPEFTVGTPHGTALVALEGPLWEGREYLLPGWGLRLPDGQSHSLRVRVHLREERGLVGAEETARAVELASRAREALAHSDLGQALALSAEALGSDPGVALAHAVRGATLGKQGDYANGLPELRRAVDLDHRSPRYWYYMGSTYLRGTLHIPALAAACGGMLRDRRSQRLQRLWTSTLPQVFAPYVASEDLTRTENDGLQALWREVQGSYLGTAGAAIDDMLGRHPRSPILHAQRGAIAWLLSVQGREPSLGLAYAHLARAAMYSPESQEYATTLGEIDEVIRRYGSVAELLDAGSALISRLECREAFRLVMAAAEKLADGQTLGTYEQWAQELTGSQQVEVADERSVADAWQSLRACLSQGYAHLDRVQTLTAAFYETYPECVNALQFAGDRCEVLQRRAPTAPEDWGRGEVRSSASRLKAAVSERLAHVFTLWPDSNELGTSLNATGLAGRQEVCRLSTLTTQGLRLANGTASGETIGRWAEACLRLVERITEWLEHTKVQFTSMEADLRRTCAAASFSQALLNQRFGMPDPRSQLQDLVASVGWLQDALHLDTEDRESRELLAQVLEHFGEVADPMVQSGLGMRTDLFSNTMDAVAAQATGKYTFATSPEELLYGEHLALFDWAAEVLTQDQPVFPQEFLLGARRDCWALTNYRLVHAQPPSTGFVILPLSRIAAYEQRAAGLTRVHVLIDLKDGTRVVFNDVGRKDAAPTEWVRWAIGAQMWKNLRAEDVEVLDSGRQVEELPRPIAAAKRELSAPQQQAPALLSEAPHPLCPGCGAAAIAGDHFCRRCGAPLSLNALPVTGTTSPTDPNEGLQGGDFGDYVYTNFGAGSFADLFGDLLAQRGAGAPQQAQRGQDIHHRLPVSFADAVKGAKRDLAFTVADRCPECDGLGGKAATCPTCKGSGQVGQRGFSGMPAACPQCQGSGEIITERCGACRGGGEVARERQVTLTIPAGVHTGQMLRLAGEGGRGFRGAPNGDLILELQVEEPPSSGATSTTT
jgi:tetratricopeptide (TPR) repeat protein